MTHWASTYVGIPWKFGGESLDGFDCYGLFRHLMYKYYDISVPVVTITEGNYAEQMRGFGGHGELGNWEPVDEPQDGDGVLLTTAKYPTHVGVYVEGDGIAGIMHCVQGIGVGYMPRGAVANHGWKVLRYYRHRSRL